MKEGWEVKKLKDVCEKTNNIRWQDFTKEEFEYIDLSSVSRETLRVIETTTVGKENAPSRAKKIVQEGDVIFATTRPTLKRVTIIDGNLSEQICSTGFCVLRPNKSVLSGYMFYFILTPSFMDRMERLQRGASYPAVTDADVKSTEIPIPPLPEQKQIVAILDKAFAAINQAQANIEKNIENAKELFQSKLNEIFSQKGDGWEEKSLGEITSKIGSGATPRGGQKSYKEEGISLIRSLNVYDDGFRPEKLAFIDEEQAEKLDNVTIEEGDVLLNITGASVARCCIAPNDYLPARVNQHVSIIRIENQIILPEFLHFSLIAKENKDKLLGIGDQGATRQAITKTQIQKFKITFPINKETQKQIVNQLNDLKTETEEIESHYQQKLANLEELKKSILQKAFSGELTSTSSATTQKPISYA